MRGVIPMLKTIYTVYFSSTAMSSTSQQSQAEITVLRNLVLAVLVSKNFTQVYVHSIIACTYIKKRQSLAEPKVYIIESTRCILLYILFVLIITETW